VLRSSALKSRQVGTAVAAPLHEPFKRQPGPSRTRRIDIGAEYDLRAWADWFGVEEAQIEEAVRTVGDRVEAVERYFNRDIDAI
jgi:hypothetical protein